MNPQEQSCSSQRYLLKNGDLVSSVLGQAFSSDEVRVGYQAHVKYPFSSSTGGHNFNKQKTESLECERNIHLDTMQKIVHLSIDHIVDKGIV